MYFLFKNGDFPASYVCLPEGTTQLLGVFFVKETFREEFDEEDEVASPSCSAQGQVSDGGTWRIIPVSTWWRKW